MSDTIKEKKKNILKEIFDFIVMVIIIFVLVTFLQSEVYAQTEVNQCSMQNTLFEGQRLIIEKISEPDRGDIIVFLKGEEIGGFWGRLQIHFTDLKKSLNKDFRANRLIKRVIGMPGDTIDIKDGQVYINGTKIEESYIKGQTYSTSNLVYPLTVQEDEYFVMGDNRENSNDSRAFGLINKKSVEGKVLIRVWPFSKFGKVD